jgi:hypothetical protein
LVAAVADAEAVDAAAVVPLVPDVEPATDTGPVLAEEEDAGAAVAAGATEVLASVPPSRMIAVSPRTIAAASMALVPSMTVKRMCTHFDGDVLAPVAG